MNLWKTIQQYVSETQISEILGSEIPQFEEARCAVKAYLDSAKRFALWNANPTRLEQGKTILHSDPQFQIAALLAALAITSAARQGSDYPTIFRLKKLISMLLRKPLPFSEMDIQWLVQIGAKAEEEAKRAVIRIIEGRVKAGFPISIPVRAGLETWRAEANLRTTGVNTLRLQIQINDLLAGVSRAPLLAGEPWGDAIQSELIAMPLQENAHWSALLSHAMMSSAAKPSAKWLKQANLLLDAMGREAFATRFAAWSNLFQANHFPPNNFVDGYDRYMEWMRLSAVISHNYAALKGLVWCCRLLDGAGAPVLLGELADHALRKIPGHGPKSAKIGNACILTLGAMAGMEPVAQLSRLKRRVKYTASLGMIDAALSEAAIRAGLPPEDLEELATPTFGLDESGRRREELGDYFADLLVTPLGGVELIWSDSTGKTLKSVPAEVRKDHGEAAKELKLAAGEIGKTLPALRARLESFLMTDRSWPLADWRERYLDHPLAGVLARRLIWKFTDGERSSLGIWRDGALVDEAGRPLEAMSDSATVRLWHPLDADAKTVLAWRRRLEADGLQQPFKQAHREIYLLTDAELATETYSNRFAAHILRQHQFQALCRERGWSYQLQGGFDSYNTPTLILPKHDLRVEFWVEATGDNALSASYINLYISTDQVRFYNTQGRQLRLADVPPRLFSEIMRDVDLFVGVCSIGNDPNWGNNAGLQAHGDYWRGFSFGDLTATAQTRCDVLSRLLPRLKIAAQCTMDGRFLRVQGSLRTYKIHLGSGNILMEPNDQYLCIVPDRRKDAASDVFLPFEGDQLLAVILSKAFLLVDDGKIKDPTILRQIRV